MPQNEATKKPGETWRGKARRDSKAPVTVYLTFDDGPEKGVTLAILDILKQVGAPAAFFVNASSKDGPMPDDPDQRHSLLKPFFFDYVLKILASEGNVLGNHTYSHYPLRPKDYAAEGSLGRSEDGFTENVDELAQVFTEHETPYPPLVVARLPGGGPPNANYGKFLAMVKTKIKVPHVRWHNELRPTRLAPENWPEQDWLGITGIRAEQAGAPTNGTILLLHDRHWNTDTLQGQLQAALEHLKDKLGVTFGSLRDPLGQRDSLGNTIVYPDGWSMP
jgi:peptidoglycan/xylan/chitin deacetylase (PgdA/CDA1 family)